MKKLLLSLFVFAVWFSVKAQSNVYHPFPDSNAVWTESYGYLDNGSIYVNCNKIEFLGSDTIISSVHYKKVLSTGYCYVWPDTALYTNNIYEGAIRQDSINKKNILLECFKYK